MKINLNLNPWGWDFHFKSQLRDALDSIISPHWALASILLPTYR